MDPKVTPPDWLKWDEESIKSHNKTKNKYKYVYGIKDIQMSYKNFSSASVYVSKPFIVDGNVVEVSLDVDEYNPALSTLSKSINPFDTSIEYYICFKESFDPEKENAWIPILPRGKELIENEVLLFKDNQVASLRFQRDPNKETIIYKNGIKLNNQYWSYGKDNTIRIDKRFDKYAVYTIKYHPDMNVSSPWDIELTESNRKIESFLEESPPRDSNGNILYGEIFTNGTDRNGSILLSKHPYVDYARINSDPTYKPIEVFLKPGAGYYGDKEGKSNISGPGGSVIKTEITSNSAPAKTKNITDYKYRSEPILKLYDTALGDDGKPINLDFEYYQDGRRLYFTETFNNSHIVSNMTTNHGDADIRVKYDYLKTSVRLKIILRNTSNKDNALTPIIRGYNLIFKVMR